MAKGYFGTHLSENIIETPEKYLICQNAVIARTGFQKYSASELREALDKLEVEYELGDTFDVYRDPSEVFHPDTIKSFEGKPFTVSHPTEWLSPTNIDQYEKGHLQNVRRGEEALDDGNYPLLADVFIKHEDALRQVRSGKRELSCGYDYKLFKTEAGTLEQREIRGNHLALVDDARAGEDARINDAKGSNYMNRNMRQVLMGLGFKVFAKDAEPEEIARAATAMRGLDGKEEEEVHENKERSLDKRRARDREDREDYTDRDTERGRDVEMFEGPEGYVHPIRGSKGYSKKKAGDSARDCEGMDADEEESARLHKALDRALDKRRASRQRDARASDVDMDELRRLLDEHLEEEEEEPEHSEESPLESEDESSEAERKKYIESPQPTPTTEREDAGEYSYSKGADSALAVLKAMRPIIARSTDSKLKKQFSTLYKASGGIKSKAGDGNGYKRFSAATRTRSQDAKNSELFGNKVIEEQLNSMYAELHKK